jgi:alpha-tubulin suppressor-like RCC1 family protein
MSFSINRTVSNKPVKKNISLTTTPKISSNRSAFNNPNAVNLEKISLNNISIDTNATSLNSLNTTAGVADNNKALITNASNNITNINTINCSSLTVNNQSVTGIYENSNPSNSNISYIKGTTAGIVDYNKLMITDSSKNIKNINNVDTTELKIQNSSLKINNTIPKSKINISLNLKYNIPETFVDLYYISSTNTFIGCSSTKIYTSSNGQTWTTVYTNTTFSFVSITYSSSLNMIIVVSNKDIIKSTNNGANWTVQNFTSITGANTALKSISWSPALNLFNLIHYYTANGSTHELYVSRSSDGNSWLVSNNFGGAWTSTVYFALGNNLTWNAINNQFEILNAIGYAYSSTGISWSFIPTNTSSSTNSVPIIWSQAYKEYIGVYGTNPSRDSTITSLTSAISGGIWKSSNFLGEVPSLKVFIAIENNNIIYTFDFLTWYVSNKAMYTTLNRIRSENIMNNDNSSIYIWQNNIISLDINRVNNYLDLTYYDTINNSLNVGIQSICYSESLNLYVAISNTNANQRIITSSDGINWTLRNTPNNNWVKITYSNQLNLFVCIANSGNDRIMISSNGINWNTNNIIYTPSNNPIVTYNNIAGGDITSIILLSNGTIKTCGDNTYGQLGDNSLIKKTIPVTVSNINNAIAIAAGYYHSLALLSNGTIQAWGYNATGQLGDNSTTQRNIPVTVSNISNAIAIAAGNSHSLALLSDGTIKAWGRNNVGQLGDNSTTQRNTPVTVSNINNAIAIATSFNHSLALLSDGTIQAWGDNAHGQLGDNSTTQRNIPVTVSNISNAIAIAAGNSHSLALLSNGTIKAWGYNATGQLGDNSTTQRNIPVTVSNISNAIAIAAGNLHSLALLSDGTIKAWGYNYYGQLGNNSTNNSNIPVTVSNITNVISIAVGTNHSLAVLKNGIIQTWGHNSEGQLGDTSFTQRNTPVYVMSYSSPNTLSRFSVLKNVKLNYDNSDLSFKNYNWNDIIWSNKNQLFVAVANSNSTNPILISSDGLTWISQIVPYTHYWTNIQTINDQGFIIYTTNESNSSEQKAITSTDGYLWFSLMNSTDNNITLSTSINSIVTTNINSNINILYNNGINMVSYNLITVSTNESIYKANLITPNPTFYLKNIILSNGINYKTIYISKLNQYILLINNTNKILIAYNTPTSWVEYTLSTLSNLSNISDIVWNENSNILLITTNNSTNPVIIKSKDLTLTNYNYNNLANPNLATYNSTNPIINTIPFNNFANRISNIVSYSYSSSSILNTDIQWIPELNNYYAFTNFAYSSELGLLINGLSSPTFSSGANTVQTATITPSGFSSFTQRITPTFASNQLGIWTVNYWCKQLKLFFLGNTTINSNNTYRILSSYNGIDWRLSFSDSSSSSNSLIKNFEWIEKYQILVAYTGSSSGSSGGIISSDGVNWTTSGTLFYSNNVPINYGCYSPELNLIVLLSTTTGTIYYGPPFSITALTTLSSVPNLSTDTLQFIRWIPQLSIFIILTNTTKIGISKNGINWYSYTVPVAFNNVNWLDAKQQLVFTTSASSNTPVYICNFYSNSLNISDLNNNKFLNYSNDCLNNVYSQTTPNTNAWKSITYSGDLNLFVAISNTGTNNRIMTSDDGWNWTAQTSAANNDWTSICWSSDLDLFVAVAKSGTGNRIMTSSDGITWTSQTSPADNDWTSVCWSEDLLLFVAVASSGTNNRVMTSADGINWTLRTNSIDNNWTSVCWGNIGLFVAISNTGTNNRIMTSNNGVNWTIRTSPANNNWSSICWANNMGLYIAVASSGTNNRIMTSSDGINWTLRTNSINNNWKSICYSPELNLAVVISNTDTNGIMKSTDGINWSNINIPNKNWEAICWSNQLGIFTAVSSSANTDDVIISNITLTGIHNTIPTINSKCTQSINQYNKNMIIGNNNILNTQSYGILQVASNINNETMRLTHNNSATNNVDFNVNADASQLNIITNGTDKIINIENHNLLSTGLHFNGTLLTASTNDINKLNVTLGSASSSKVITVDGNRNLSNLNTITANKCIVNNNFVLSNNDNNSSYIQNITPGTAEASKCLVVDSNNNLSGLNQINSSAYKINNTTINNSTIINNYKFDKVFNNGISNNYPSNIQVYGSCWSPELEIFVVVGSGWYYPTPLNGSFSPIMTSTDGTNWEAKYVTNNNITLKSIVWSAELNLFITVGNNGYIYSSKDGNIWTPRSTSGSSYTSISWSPSLTLFVAIGSNTIMTSPDGIVWTSRTSPSNVSWTSIVWSSSLSLFAIVANNGTSSNQIATSSNGTSWTNRNSPSGASLSSWTSITWSPILSLFIAVADSGTNRIMSSSDGITWTNRMAPSTLNYTYVSWLNTFNIFVAIPLIGTSFHKSSDGINWEVINNISPINFNFRTISSSQNLIVSGGLHGNNLDGSRIIISTDTTNWNFIDTNYNGWNSVQWINEQNLYLGLSSMTPYRKMVITSSDGINWMLNNSNIVSITSIDFNFLNYIWISSLNLFIAAGTQNRILTSSDAITWTLRTLPSVSTFNNASFAWSSSLNLIVLLLRASTSNVQIYTSSNGINWTSRTAPTPTNVGYTNVQWVSSLNLFIAASTSNYYILYSNDGITWTNRLLTLSFYINSIQWIPEVQKFILTPINGQTYAISNDGITWIEQNLSLLNYVSGSYVFSDNFIWINEYNILINIAINSSLFRHILLYTTDLLNWNIIPLTFHNNIVYNKIVYSSTLKQLIIYGTDFYRALTPFITYNLVPNNDLSLSTNLSNISNLIKPNSNITNDSINTWNAISFTYSNNLTSICYSNYLQLFVAVANTGTGNRVITSSDGITWTSRTSAADNNWTSICWAPLLKLFVAVSNTGTANRVMTSSNGTTWILQTSAADNNWTSICWSEELNLFVAVANSGTNNRFMISINGIIWSTFTVNNNNNWTSICWSSELGLFVAVASSGTANRIITSPDGLNWTLRTNPIDNDWTSVCWSKELSLFVAVANTGTGNRIMTSPDGITWTIRTSPADNNWNSVIWASEISTFVAVANSGTNNRVMVSNDGINWTTKSNSVDNDWTSICWNSDLEIFIAVSSSGTNNRILSSNNNSVNNTNIIANESIIKTTQTSFKLTQDTNRVGLGLNNPAYQLHLSNSTAAKPGTSTWTVSSDIRLKENIENADLDICYNNIKNLPLKRYKWKDDIYTTEQVPDRHQLGWIAQDVEQILPKSVKTINQFGISDCKTLNNDQIIANMHGCTKKILNIYENQQIKINKLMNDINNLQNFIDTNLI